MAGCRQRLGEAIEGRAHFNKTLIDFRLRVDAAEAQPRLEQPAISVFDMGLALFSGIGCVVAISVAPRAESSATGAPPSFNNLAALRYTAIASSLRPVNVSRCPSWRCMSPSSGDRDNARRYAASAACGAAQIASNRGFPNYHAGRQREYRCLCGQEWENAGNADNIGDDPDIARIVFSHNCPVRTS